MGCAKYQTCQLDARVRIQENEIKILRKWKEDVIARLAIVEKVEESIPKMGEDIAEINDMIDKHITARFENMKKKGIAILIVASLMMNGGINFGPDLIKTLIAIFGG